MGGFGQATRAPAFFGVAAQRVHELGQGRDQLCRSNSLLPKLLDLSLVALDCALYRLSGEVSLIVWANKLVFEIEIWARLKSSSTTVSARQPVMPHARPLLTGLKSSTTDDAGTPRSGWSAPSTLSTTSVQPLAEKK